MKSKNIEAQLTSIIDTYFSPHPFSSITKNDDLEKIFSLFIGLSQSTPYILGGASKELFFKKIRSKQAITNYDEMTTSVLSFLAWDETGGQEIIQKYGPKALQKILESKNYHSRILAQDLSNLLGKTITASYDSFSIDYLDKVILDLSQTSDISRCASIIAFEMHAENIITALWDVLGNLFPSVDKSSLNYFELHVGENPVEEYHVEMTTKMVTNMVSKDQFELFLTQFKQSYQLNFNWAKNAKN